MPAFEGAKQLQAELEAAPSLPCAARQRLRAILPLPRTPVLLLPPSAVDEVAESGDALMQRAGSSGGDAAGGGAVAGQVCSYSPWLAVEARGSFSGWSSSSVYHASLASAALPRPPCALSQALQQHGWSLLAGAVRRRRDSCDGLGEALLLSV